MEDILRNITAPLLVGVSGGPDSLALLHVVANLDLSPIAVYYNHMLREDAPQEEIFVRDFAQSLGVSFRGGAGDVRLYADEQGLSVEEAARILRYMFLFQTAADMGASAVAVAHHADDQIETILMNLLRGTGMRGMLGMQVVSLPNPWSDSIPLLRPFLGIGKDQILEYVNEHQLNPLIDPSNAELIYQRNRIRHELIPLLERLAPGFRQRLLQTAEILSGDEQALEEITESTWKSCLEDQSDHQIQLNREVFRKSSPSIQRRLIRRTLKILRPEFRELSFQQVKRALEYIQDPIQKSANWVAKVSLCNSQNRVIFSTWESELVTDQFPQLLSQKVITPKTESEIPLGKGWYFSVQPISISPKQTEQYQNPEDDFQVWIDQGSMGEEVVLRIRKKGDVFSPLGMGGKTMKVSDLMINEKIPAKYRANWPMLVSEDTILWVPGAHLSHEARIKESTKSVLKLSFIKRIPRPQ